MAKKVIIGLVVVLILASGVYFLTRKDSDGDVDTNNSKNTPASSADAAQAAATITYSDSGFSPSSVTVKSGDIVAIKNTSSREMQFDSDPHPAHTNNTELNVNLVAPGQTLTFTAKTTGTFGYHNHLNPSQTGMIIVK